MGARRGGAQAATGELARVALADDVLLDRGPDYARFLHACYSAIRGGHLDLAIEVLGRAIGEAGARGSLLGFGFASCYRGMDNVLRGDLDAADADLRIALDAARDNGWTLLEWQVLNFWLILLAERGDVAQAQAELERGGLEGDLVASMVTTGLLSARAVVRYAQGRWRDAYDDFVECGRLEAPYSKRAQNFWWRADAAMALAHLGEHQRALMLADEDLEIARGWGDPKTWVGPCRREGWRTVSAGSRISRPRRKCWTASTTSGSRVAWSTSARRCVAAGAAVKPGSRCAGRSSSPNGSAHTATRSAHASSSRRPGRDRARSCALASIRSPPASCDRPAGGGRPLQSGDRPASVRDTQDRRSPPRAHLPQARHQAPRAARRHAAALAGHGPSES